MKTILIPATVIGSLLLSTPATAEIKKDEDGWSCGSTEDWEFVSLVVAPKFGINNFHFGEKRSMRSGLRVLEIQFNTVNRREDNYNFSSQFAGWSGDGKLLFAMSVSPLFDAVGTGVGTVEGDIYVQTPTLASVKRICAKFAVAN